MKEEASFLQVRTENHLTFAVPIPCHFQTGHAFSLWLFQVISTLLSSLMPQRLFLAQDYFIPRTLGSEFKTKGISYDMRFMSKQKIFNLRALPNQM